MTTIFFNNEKCSISFIYFHFLFLLMLFQTIYEMNNNIAYDEKKCYYDRNVMSTYIK